MYFDTSKCSYERVKVKKKTGLQNQLEGQVSRMKKVDFFLFIIDYRSEGKHERGKWKENEGDWSIYLSQLFDYNTSLHDCWGQNLAFPDLHSHVWHWHLEFHPRKKRDHWYRMHLKHSCQNIDFIGFPFSTHTTADVHDTSLIIQRKFL